jgi:hypothetical protein
MALDGETGFGRDHGRRPSEAQQPSGVDDAHLSLVRVRRKAERPAVDAIGARYGPGLSGRGGGVVCAYRSTK